MRFLVVSDLHQEKNVPILLHTCYKYRTAIHKWIINCYFTLMISGHYVDEPYKRRSASLAEMARAAAEKSVGRR